MKLSDVNKTKKIVKSSVEISSGIPNIIASIIFVACVILVWVLILSGRVSTPLPDKICIAFIILVLMFICFFSRRRKILQNIGCYEFYEGFVDAVNGSDRSMSLHISAKAENGETLSLDTRAIYDSYSRMGPNPYCYYEKRVLVGYNKATNTCVIIRTFRENETLEECIERAMR